jgi:hypothetical protein
MLAQNARKVFWNLGSRLWKNFLYLLENMTSNSKIFFISIVEEFLL